ncbi:MAG: hypothetical protein U1A27_02710 [Phycisphaerae bacterium]
MAGGTSRATRLRSAAELDHLANERAAGERMLVADEQEDGLDVAEAIWLTLAC